MNTQAQRRQNRQLRRLRQRQRERRRQRRQEHQSRQSAPSPFAVAAVAAATPPAKAHTPAQLLSQAKLLQSIAKIVEKQTVRLSREEARSKLRAGLSE